MAIKNYSTKVAASKTVGEVMEMLASHGADSINIEYGENGPDDWSTYCLGVYKDGIPYVMDRECLRCGAYADNATPLPRTEASC